MGHYFLDIQYLLQDIQISKEHAVFKFAEQGWTLTDRSSNGIVYVFLIS